MHAGIGMSRGGALAQGYYIYLLDEVRPGDEAGGAPEQVVDVGAERLQLRGEAAVDDRAPARLRHELLQRPHHRAPVQSSTTTRSAARSNRSRGWDAEPADGRPAALSANAT